MTCDCEREASDQPGREGVPRLTSMHHEKARARERRLRTREAHEQHARRRRAQQLLSERPFQIELLALSDGFIEALLHQRRAERVDSILLRLAKLRPRVDECDGRHREPANAHAVVQGQQKLLERYLLGCAGPRPVLHAQDERLLARAIPGSPHELASERRALAWL